MILGQYSAWAQGFLHNQCYFRRSCCVLSHKNSIRETWLYTKHYDLEDKELRFSTLGLINYLLLENYNVISYNFFRFIKMELQCMKASKTRTYLWFLFFINSFLNGMVLNLRKWEEGNNYVVSWQQRRNCYLRMHTKLGIVYTSNELFGDRTWQNNVTNLLPLLVSVEKREIHRMNNTYKKDTHIRNCPCDHLFKGDWYK